MIQTFPSCKVKYLVHCMFWRNQFIMKTSFDIRIAVQCEFVIDTFLVLSQWLWTFSLETVVFCFWIKVGFLPVTWLKELSKYLFDKQANHCSYKVN
jgi:hypothetical protein